MNEIPIQPNGLVDLAESGHRLRPSLDLAGSLREQLVGRIIPGAFFTLLLAATVGQLRALWGLVSPGRTPADAMTFWASLAYQGLLVVYLSLVVALFVIRFEPVRKADSYRARLIAQVGAFLLTGVAILPRRSLGSGTDLAASFLLLLGMGITLAALMYLGRCFSIMPEIRGLVLSGPYRWVRHPMYLGEFLSGLGLVLASLSWTSVALYAGFVWLQVERMNYEETGLARHMDAYRPYLRTTRRVIPWVY